jgi:DNA-binding MarR family transcriptional regulator
MTRHLFLKLYAGRMTADTQSVRWLDQCEARAWRSLQEMHLRLSARLARELSENSDLSLQDYVVLVMLTDRPEGMIRLFELARMLGWEQSRLSHHVSRMAARGLVEKHTCSLDRRGAYVAVTEAGRLEIEAAAPGHVAAVRRLFVDLLSADQLEVLGDVCETVLGALDEKCAGPDCDGPSVTRRTAGQGARRP